MRLATTLLEANELQQLQQALAQLSWSDGRSSAGWLAREVKHNLQADSSVEAMSAMQKQLKERIENHELVRAAARPARLSAPLFNAYHPGMQYGSHTDDAWIAGVRSDLAYTLFLSEPDQYEGGELVIEDVSGEYPYKLPAGSLLLYDCGALHRVQPVTAGVRYAAVGWIQSHIADPALRQDLFDLEQVRQSLRGDAQRLSELRLLSQVQGRLLRRFGA